MKKVLFIDRDGTLVIEPPLDFQVDSLEKLEFYPGVFQWLARIAHEMDYQLVMVSNQDGLGTPSFPEENFWPVQNKIVTAFKNEGVVFSEVLIDRSFPADQLPTRKPGTGMLTHYMRGGYDLEHSYVIGDRLTDVELAENLSCKSIYLGSISDRATFSAKNWKEVYDFLKAKPRIASVLRNTNETRIQVVVNLDGSGEAKLDTGISFFDHLLEQICRHGLIDMTVQVQGDLHVDEHHTVEDTALTLGAAFKQALGAKKGIERYGFLLPMDDALAQVAIDFGGRPWLVWDAEFKREMIGAMPTELFVHFFKSFSDAAACNINIKADGFNEHHKIEAIFKGFAKAIRMAVRKTNDYSIPSTKGSI